jgi:multidrug transporter EmrE-like cation transporter
MDEVKFGYWGALLVAVMANVVANSAFKVAVSAASARSGRLLSLELLAQGSLWIGVAFAFVLLVAYLVALRGLPASIAYVGVSTLAVVGLVIVDKALFGVPVGASKLAGIALAVAGVWLIAKAT